ncbi:hypothetical protein P7C71_g6518, partial [Lecanoromycetidae sp. Uapishka_2]
MEYQYLKGLAYATDTSTAPKINTSSHESKVKTTMHDPFIDKHDDPESAPRFAEAYAAYDRFGGNIDQSQQLSQYGQLHKYHSNLYGQQPAYQQQLGYGQVPYNPQPEPGYASTYGLNVTSNTHMPSRLPYQAVRGTQAEATLKEYTNMSTQMQKAFIEVGGYASPRDLVNAGSGMPRTQPRDTVPYTGFVQQELNEGAEKHQQASPSSARTVLHDPTWRSPNNASTIGNMATTAGQPRQMYPAQHDPAMSKSETEKAIMEGLLHEAMAAPAPMGPARGAQQLKELTGPQFEAFSAVTRQTARNKSKSFLQNVEFANLHYEQIKGQMPCDENGRPLNANVREASAGPYAPSAVSQGQSVGSDSWTTTDMTNSSEEVPESLKEAAAWYDKPTEDAKSARDSSIQRNSPRNRHELSQGSEALPANLATPTKYNNGQVQPYMSPIGTGRPRSGRTSRSTVPFTEGPGVTTLQHMKEYKETAQANGSDSFTKFGQPPAHTINHSANGNKSLFGTEWNPPARVGRDPRHQTTMHDGRPILFMEPPSASGSDGRGGRPF